MTGRRGLNDAQDPHVLDENLRRDPARHRGKRLRGRRVGGGDHDRQSLVAAGADPRVDRHLAEERHLHRLGHFRPPPLPKISVRSWQWLQTK